MSLGYHVKVKPPVNHQKPNSLLPPIKSKNVSSKCIPKTETRNVSREKNSKNIRLPIISSKYYSKTSGNMVNYVAMLESNLLEVPETFDNPEETLKIALQCLRQNQWQSSTSAIINVMQISRFHPELLDAHMPLIYRTLCSLLKNIRPQIVRVACQVAMELFKTMQCTLRPEFDELAATLLLKSTHVNKAIHHDAQRALDTMVAYVSPSISIRVLVNEHGASHKNPLIHVTVSRLLFDIINIIKVDHLITNYNLKDTRQKIFIMCAKFLVSGNQEVRNNTKKALKLMMTHCDFDTVFYQEIDRKLLDKIEKQVVLLKYE